MFLVAQAGQLFGDTEAAALPSLLESGRLPARISGLPASGRALLAASMHAQLDAPVLAVCPDEAAAELFQKDLAALLGQDVPSRISKAACSSFSFGMARCSRPETVHTTAGAVPAASA